MTKLPHLSIALVVLAVPLVFAYAHSQIDAEEFDEYSNLLIPTDIDDHDSHSPGLIEEVRTDQKSYRLFHLTGRFASGTMLSLQIAEIGHCHKPDEAQAGLIGDTHE